jgi:protein TonB
MVIRQPIGAGASLAYLLDGHQQRRGLSRPAMIGIGAAVLLHVAGAAYLYNMRVGQFTLMPQDPPAPPIVAIFPPDKPKPPEPQPQAQKHARQDESQTTRKPDEISPVKPDETLKVPPGDRSDKGPPLASDPTPTKPAEPDLPKGPPVIGNPSWISKPTAEQVGRYYPSRALATNMAGLAVLQCHVAANGSVGNCSVVSETPADFGFGAAGLKLARFFKMSPRT